MTHNIDTETIIHSPEFKSLLKKRRQLSISVAATMIATYFGFILIVAFKPSILAITFGNSIISVGIYAGLFLLILGFVLTALYIQKSNKFIDPLQKEIQDKYQ